MKIAAADPASPSPGRHLARPALAYFVVAFAVSWAGALVLVAPRLLRGEPIPKFTGLMMFPVMLVGPAAAGILLTARSRGFEGLHTLWRRMTWDSIPLRWYAVLLIPPALVLLTLSVLAMAVSPRFAPNHFFIGALFGIVAGFVEEIGWTGFAFPALARTRSTFSAAVILGMLWGLWHIPVVDYLGAATPHGRFWLPYLLAFIAAMSAIRVLICWAYTHTGSVLLAQVLHAASTGALVVFSPAVSAGEETIWYLMYAAAMWCFAIFIVAAGGMKPMGEVAETRAATIPVER